MKTANAMLKLILLSLISATLFSCAQSKRDRLQGTGSGVRAGNASSSLGVGMIYDNGSVGNFQTNVQRFVSSWMNYTLLGTVDGSISSTSTGIDFKGHFTFNGSTLVQSSSNFVITIYDSYAANGQADPLPVTFDSAKYSNSTCPGTLTGSKNASTGAFTVVASDCYGTVTFQGTAGASTTAGYVSFNNKYSSMNFTNQTAVLGAFKISTSALF